MKCKKQSTLTLTILINLCRKKVRYRHYYKMWMQFISPYSLDQWIHSKSSEITWHTITPFVVVRLNDWTLLKIIMNFEKWI